MRYELRYKPKAQKALKKMPHHTATRLIQALERLTDNLAGDVKRLTEHEPAYRLRVGDYRVLFDVIGSAIIVYEIWPRQHGYR